MSRKNSAAKRSNSYERPIAYDREILIEIGKRVIGREDIQKICASRGMPVAPVFFCWIRDHKEAREIFLSARNLEFDRGFSKEMGERFLIPDSEWEESVRARLARGWPADVSDRKYVPPDWNKVYPLIGYPPVRPNENTKAYDDLISVFTQMLEPRDLRELMLTKEATDATWEERRTAREKNALPEWKYQRRQVLDTAQSRAIKRRDHAVRQIERWRAGLGATARRLPDHLLCEEALAECYGVDQSLADAENDATLLEAEETAPTLASEGEAAGPAAPPRAQADEATRTAAPHASLGGEVTQEAVEATCSVADRDARAAKAAAPLVHVDEAMETATALAPAGQATEAVLPPAPIGDATESAGPAPAVDELAKPAAPLVRVVYSRRPAARLTGLDEAAEPARPLAPTGGDPMEAVPTPTPRSEAPLLTRLSEAAIPAAVERVPHAMIEG
jgi:hypothetical protein